MCILNLNKGKGLNLHKMQPLYISLKNIYRHISDSINTDTDISVTGQYWSIISVHRYIGQALVYNVCFKTTVIHNALTM